MSWGTVLLVGLFIKPMYAPLDYPYFTFMEPLDYVLLILLGGCMIFVIKHKEGLETMLDLRIVTLVFSVTAILFISLVPLKPFSDMQYVYESAIDFSTMNREHLMAADYWKVFPTNVRLGILWGVLLLPFPKSLITMKVFNALFVYLTAFFTAKLCRPLHIKCPKILFTLTLFFLPVIFCINHIYFDHCPCFFWAVLDCMCI